MVCRNNTRRVAAVSDEKTPRHQPVEGEHVLDQVASDAPIIVEDPDDCAVVVAAGHDPSASAVHVYDYFVVYSSTYQVPVLYFQASHLDGRMLTWEEVWADVPSHHRDEDIRWNFITQQEHPVTGVPCFHIHPCETKALMTSLTADASTPSPSSSNYLMAWLSAVGPVVGLHLPLTAWLSPASTNAPPYPIGND